MQKMKVLLVGGFMSILLVSSIVSAQTFTVKSPWRNFEGHRVGDSTRQEGRRV